MKDEECSRRGVSFRVVLTLIISAAAAAVLLLSGRSGWDKAVLSQEGGAMKQKVRPAAVAGQFYPGSAGELSKEVERYLSEGKNEALPGRVRALIVPHAGYIYSGPIAGSGYAAVDPPWRRVFILASNHSRVSRPFKFSISGAEFFQTPLGRVKVSFAASELLQRHNGLFSEVEEAQDSHVIEVQLPFLQKILGGFEIVPIVVGWADVAALTAAASAIEPYIDEETLLIVSSDLSHYHPYSDAVKLDRSCIAAFEALDLSTAAGCEACGLDAALILMRIAGKRGWKGRILDYRNSGDTAGRRDEVVGYSAVAYYDPASRPAASRPGQEQKESSNASLGDEFTEQDTKALLSLSRASLEAAAAGRTPAAPDPAKMAAILRRNFGCFVTLEKSGALRGCIGTIAAREPLYQCVIDNTVNAAHRDDRFSPVTLDETADIEIEISILSSPVMVAAEARLRLLPLLKERRPGVILHHGPFQATFLPQVWEDLPDPEEFLETLCRKGGMPRDCWKDPETKVETYEVFAFKEQRGH